MKFSINMCRPVSQPFSGWLPCRCCQSSTWTQASASGSEKKFSTSLHAGPVSVAQQTPQAQLTPHPPRAPLYPCAILILMGTHDFTAAESRQQMDWLAKVVGQESRRSFAERINLSPRSVQNWFSRGRIPADAVLKISSEIGLNPIHSLVDTGYLPAFWREEDQPETRSFSIDELLNEIGRRVSPQSEIAIRAIVDAEYKR